MIVQAIGLLDELDKEINTYAMRVKEWCVETAFTSPTLILTLARILHRNFIYNQI